MTLSLLPNPRQQFFGSDGKPLAGGKVYTYAAGTSTPKATYTDAAGVVPNTNPIILNARGEATVFWSGSYKVTVTTSADVTIYTQDNVTGPDVGLRSDLAASTGAAAIGIAGGGTVQDLASIYANAVFSASYASVEAAHAAAVSAGKTYVVVNSAWALTGNFTATRQIMFALGFTVSCGAYTLNLSNGFIATDYQRVFLAADASKITLPQWQRLTPQHFGALADYVNSGSPGNNDGPALQAWASKLCTRVMPAGKYGVAQTIHWNGDGSGTVTNQNTGMQCDPQAWIVQRTSNIPIMTVWGSRAVWTLPVLQYETIQSATDYGAVGLLINPYPGQTGWYSNVVNRIYVAGGANVGIFNPPAIASTTTATYSAGASSIVVANAQTDALGSYPWVPGMWVQVQLDTGAYHITRLSSVSSATLGLATPLPSTATSGNIVQFTGFNAPSTFPAAEFSNTFHFLYVDDPQRYGIVLRGTGTGDAIANMYIRSAGSGTFTAPTYTIQTAVYISGTGAGSIAQLNVEYLGFNSDMIFVSSRHFKFGEIHIEGCRSYTNSTGIMAGSVADMDIDLMQVEYWTALATDIANAVGIFYPRSTPGTSLGSNRGQWRVKQLNTRKNIFERGFSASSKAFIAAYAAGNVTQIKIDSWVYNRDGGIYPSGQLASPSNVGGLVSIGNLLPPDCVAYLLDADTNSTSYQRIYTSPKGQYKIREILALKPTVSMATGGATVGVFADTGGATLISNVNNQALSTLTGTKTVLSIPLAASEAAVLRSPSTGATDGMFWKGNAAQAKPPAVVTGMSGTSSLTGRQGGDNNTNLGFINFTAAHGFNVGDIVSITGSVNAAFNAKTFKIVDVPSTTQIVVYCDSVSPVATVADTALSAQLTPTVHVVVTGTDVANFDAF